MDHQGRAKELRQSEEPHYNCCQAALLPFAEEMGLDGDACGKLCAHFGSGMRRGSVCGAVTGGLMALGLADGDSHAAAEFQRRFQARAGAMDCAALLSKARENGEEKKPHCDRMVSIAVELVDELLNGGD